MHFIFDLMRKIIRGKLHGDKVVLWGDGFQSREVVYLEDFVRIAMRLSQTRENDLINLGSGESRTIREYAALICDKVRFDFSSIRFDTGRYVGARSKSLDIHKLKTILPDCHFTPLETGIDATVDWFMTEGNRALGPRN